ncbi:MAG: hypothetical protein ACM3ZQ_01550 [Bacillota bacterium]
MKWTNIDSRYIYIIMAVVLLVPMFVPLGTPIVVSQQTKDSYKVFDGLKKGDIVWVSFDAGPSSTPELQPQVVAVSRHLAKKGVRIAYFTMYETMSAQLCDDFIRPLMAELNYKEGADWVNLGFKVGGDSLLQVAATDVWKAMAGVDMYNVPLDKYPMMNDLKALKDVSIIYSIQVGSPGTGNYITFLNAPYKTKIVSGSAGTMAANMVNTLKTGQIVGLLAGLTGGAEYEQLIGVPGKGSSSMDAQSFAHLFIVALLLVGNAGYFLNRKKGGK